MKGMKSYLRKTKNSLAVFGTCLALFLQAGVFPAFAKPAWPYDVGIEGEAGIIIDEETGAVLFGQNIHLPYAPASITKLLTALVVIENCQSLDDMVTFSHDAVYNVEEGSSNPLSIDEGDQLTIRDCLYLLLLRSSNQAANALAEHISGTRENFAALMNETIRKLGCTESNFANPSGLNDENQYVSAYDMAVIGKAAFENETLLEISSSKRYRLPATIHNPEGVGMTMEHKLLITTDQASDTYYPAAIAGKTGYTSIALNTLVTCARDNGRGQIAVILKSNWTHYSDTIALMNFGFGQFQNLDTSGDEITFFSEDGSLQVGDTVYKKEELEVSGIRKVTVPMGASLADVNKQLVTGEEIYIQAPKGAVAEIRYTYDDRIVGRSYLVSLALKEDELVEVGAGELNTEGTGSSEGDSEGTDQTEGETDRASQPQVRKGISPKVMETLKKIGPIALGAAALVGISGAIGFFIKKQRKKRREAEEKRREKRRQRLAEIGYSEEEFNRMLEERFRRDKKEGHSGKKNGTP
ncbi:MAG: D-alanyl-D-alanine carboxypeptidase [Lachnospiraceae bacterium]|jgi:D-alanyl-D-alanine carboxypeptidase (penicillin-binding protein 5/6)|nr:D-alanyl-D-alanine carboxypeptidase [Lachnospiraceae bacterium]